MSPKFEIGRTEELVMVVPITRVITTEARRWHVRKMKAVLERQGQIEPLQVKILSVGTTVPVLPDIYVTHDEDPHGADIVHAARELGWSTILILVTERYLP